MAAKLQGVLSSFWVEVVLFLPCLVDFICLHGRVAN